MNRQRVVVPGSRDVRGTLDRPDGGGDAAVVACPPHPAFGGSRRDRRLRAVAGALVDRGVACLRFDYGPRDGGEGERADVREALAWASQRYDRVGLFGYSFGATNALVVAAGRPPESPGSTEPAADLAAVSALAPGEAAAAALDAIDCPVQVVVGTRDDTVAWQPVVRRARDAGAAVVEIPGDHHFVGQSGAVARVVADFLASARS